MLSRFLMLGLKIREQGISILPSSRVARAKRMKLLAFLNVGNAIPTSTRMRVADEAKKCYFQQLASAQTCCQKTFN